MAQPDPTQVAPWYLRNINQALELDQTTGNVFVRTGLASGGNIVITGNVTIPGTIDVHIVELGNVEITGSTLPISGNVGVIGNVNVTQGTDPWKISGNVGIIGNANVVVQGNIAGITGNVTINPITGNVGITGNANVAGNVGILGNVNVTQGTDPWNVAGNVGVTGTVTTVPDLTVGDYFGEPYAIPITPVVQNNGIYGINAQDIQTYTGGGGNVTTSNSSYTASSTSTVGSYAVVRSRRFNTQKAGQSLLARMYTKFDTPAAGTWQMTGIQNEENAYYIGYNGTTFGINHVHNGRAPIYQVTVTSYTGTQTVTLTLNGTPYTTTIQTGETVNQAAQRISQIDFGGVWLATQKGNTVLLLAASVGVMGGAFTVSGSGTSSLSIAQQQAGAAATNDWKLDGVAFTKPSWLVGTRFNQYQFKYSWAGVNFFALNPNTGQYALFYQLVWAGSSSATELPVANNAFKTASLAYNVGGSTAVTVTTASMMAGLEGITNRNNYSGSQATTKTGLAQNVLHHLISIQNPFVFGNTINTKEVLLQDFTATTQCNDPTEVYVYLDAPLTTGLQDFIQQGTYPVTVSTATGTLTEGSLFPILSFVVGITGSSVQFPLEAYRVVVPPGSTMTFACVSTAAIQKAAIAVVWYND